MTENRTPRNNGKKRRPETARPPRSGAMDDRSLAIWVEETFARCWQRTPERERLGSMRIALVTRRASRRRSGYSNHTTAKAQSCSGAPYKITVGTTSLLKLVDWCQEWLENGPGGVLCPGLSTPSPPGGQGQASCASSGARSGTAEPIVAAPAGGEASADRPRGGPHGRTSGRGPGRRAEP